MTSASKISIHRSLAVACIFAAIAVLVVGVTARGQDVLPDVSGEWILTASAVPVTLQEVPAGVLPLPCNWEGGGVLVQDGAMVFSQDVTLNLVSGPAECPLEMSATLDGFLGAQQAIVVGGTPFGGTLNGGPNLGMLNFRGTVGPEGRTMTDGSLMVFEGPFSDTSGTWSAIRAPLGEIPTLGTLGLALLIAVLLASSLLMLRQRRLTLRRS